MYRMFNLRIDALKPELFLDGVHVSSYSTILIISADGVSRFNFYAYQIDVLR